MLRVLLVTACVPPCPAPHRTAPPYCLLQDQYNSIAKFLEAKGMPEAALEVATDADYRFELAVSLGMLDLALELADMAGAPCAVRPSPHTQPRSLPAYWRRLCSEAAQRSTHSAC